MSSRSEFFFRAERRIDESSVRQVRLALGLRLLTLFSHLILFHFSFVFLDLIIIHMSEWILSVVGFVDDRIVLLITFDNAFRCCTNHDNWLC